MKWSQNQSRKVILQTTAKANAQPTTHETKHAIKLILKRTEQRANQENDAQICSKHF